MLLLLAICVNFLRVGNIPTQIVRRTSLLPPPDCQVSWEDYINSEPGEYPKLGRELVYKESSKSFRATVAMV